jgi:hypothetical protein
MKRMKKEREERKRNGKGCLYYVPYLTMVVPVGMGSVWIKNESPLPSEADRRRLNEN